MAANLFSGSNASNGGSSELALVDGKGKGVATGAVGGGIAPVTTATVAVGFNEANAIIPGVQGIVPTLQ